jgi:hypothetical protein
MQWGITVPGTVTVDEGDRWATFQQLADLRGTSKRAAIMLVRRHKWPRQQNNQKQTIALVPATWAAPPEPDSGGGNRADDSSAHAVVVLEQALQALREAHAGELLCAQTFCDRY